MSKLKSIPEILRTIGACVIVKRFATSLHNRLRVSVQPSLKNLCASAPLCSLSQIRAEGASRLTRLRVAALVPCKVAGSLWLIFALHSSFTFPKQNKFVPPGTVMIYEGFYADETEITNFSWFEYEYWTRIKYGYHSPEHLSVLPDTLCDRHKLVFCEPYVQYYYRHPAYREYPVNGITFEQAIAFCKWRTERVKEWYAIAYHKKIELEFRLPTKTEWEMLSLNGLGYTLNTKTGKHNFNCLQAPDDTMVHPEYNYSSQDYLLSTRSYGKNSFGIYQMLGNVSEMVMEKGIAKGGNFLSKAEDCRAGKDHLYEKPETWLGFRCVCELKR